MWLRVSIPYCSATKRFRVSASMRRSSVCSKFIAATSQAENHLGDDVLLDFIGAAEDRQLAVVEVVGGGSRCLFRAHGLVGIAFVLGFLDEGQRVRAYSAAHQRQNFLANLGAAYLEHGAL